MKKLVASFVLLLATSTSAWASAAITCQSSGGATVHLQAFISSELLVTNVEIIANGTHWSTHNVDAEQIVIMQSFSDGESIKIDLSDPNIENTIAKIRLFGADEGANVALAGTLQIPEVGVYALICEGP